MFNDENNVEQILREDNKDKKRTAHGAVHRPSKGGGRRGMRTPFFMLNSKEQAKYIEENTGKVVNYYMDEKDINLVKSIKEIEAMPFEKAREYIIRIKNTYTARQLVKHWGMKSDYHLYQKLYKKFEIPTNKEVMAPARAALAARKKLDEQYESTVNPTADKAESIVPAATAAPHETTTGEPQSLTLTLSGTFTGEEVVARLQKLIGVVESSNTYKLFVSISE